jgi:hypothetical protein
MAGKVQEMRKTPDVFIYPNNTVFVGGRYLFGAEHDKTRKKYRVSEVRHMEMRFTASDKMLVYAFPTFTRATAAGKIGGKSSARKRKRRKKRA